MRSSAGRQEAQDLLWRRRSAADAGLGRGRRPGLGAAEPKYSDDKCALGNR